MNNKLTTTTKTATTSFGVGGSKFPLTFANATAAGPSSRSTTATTMIMNNVGTSTPSFNSFPIGGIINPIFTDPLVQIDEIEATNTERELETFPSPPPPLSSLSYLPKTASAAAASKPTTTTTKPETIDRTDSASNVSASTVITNTSSTGYAPYPPQWYYLLAADTKKFRKHRHTHYRRDCRQCREIVRSTFEQYYLRAGQQPQPQPHLLSSSSTTTMGENSSPDSIGSISLDPHYHQQQQPYSSSAYHSRPPPSPTFLANNSPTPSPLGFYSRSRASCGHSCLKFTILFYCCISVIMAICFICYLTRMFGLMAPSGGNFIAYYPSKNYSIIDAGGDNNHFISSINSTPTNELNLSDNDDDNNNISSSIMITGSNDVMDPELPATSLLETIRLEMIGLIISSAFMIIFILGLIGAFLESILCLRIFGAILSYLFLLTFGSALYIVILLIISHVQLKLILSTISCAAVAITIHGLLAIAPFAFADLISEESNEKFTEAAAAATVMANSTYFKYPSVRFFSQLPIHHHRHQYNKSGYFGFTNPATSFSSSSNRPNTNTNIIYPTSSSQQTFYRDTPIESIPTSDESLPFTTPTNNNNPSNINQGPIDNISSEGLIPPLMNNVNEHRIQNNSSGQQQQQQTVRFTDNWM
ncbi:hypothetical protein HUG17_8598 [Dermatophagoides farinae]|uniref:Uncharacterized protein n=1 Tax=Dermatophagoides farinae TaxID=6954 RepID=A0A9D4SCW0_DERFA|nr:hypothetical protein HUG17_8598 [Dermatophagoides farinae]